MKISILIGFIIIALSIKLNCGLTGSVNYSHNSINNYLLASIDIRRFVDRQSYGVYDEFKIINLTSGIYMGGNEMNYAYDFSLMSYTSFLKIPLTPYKHFQIDEYDLNDGNTYLTFSYKGPELCNLGIYKKDNNWSSIGIDLLYKNFKRNEFYTRFSYIVTGSTIINNPDYFTNLEDANKTKFCLDTKIKNSTNLLFRPFSKRSELKLETYYRIIYNEYKQKELGVNLQYNYVPSYNYLINAQVGFIRYGFNNNWNNLFKFNIGATYHFIK